MDLGLVALRLAHVVAGASWVGGAFLMILVVSRTAKLSGAQGEEFFGRLMTVGRGAKYFELIAITTVVAGALLYWRASNGLQVAWIASPTGIGFSIGAAAAIVSLVWGGTMVGPTTARLEAIGREIAAAGGVATQAQRASVDRLRTRLELFGRADLVLLAVAVAMMATARYL
ncbi:MAG TPA: hypothetical protein VFR93_05180 [Candidatus Limnocylindrales bacterium]|nr:hypothetical protein [Candidatus Limnocylindrales bacterium]